MKEYWKLMEEARKILDKDDDFEDDEFNALCAELTPIVDKYYDRMRLPTWAINDAIKMFLMERHGRPITKEDCIP